MSEYDVLVVGAGPAGASFAKKAAENDLRVLVIDKKKELGTPVRCGEGLSTHWIEKLGANAYAKAIACEIKGAKMHAPNGKNVVLRNNDTTGVVLERKIFDKMLAIDAARKGAHFLPKTIALGLTKKNNLMGVKTISEGVEKTFFAPLIVLSEGMEAKLAREAGFKALATLYDTDLCFEYEMANVECEPLIELFFSNKYAPRGYCWIFPKGKAVANVGVGVGGATGANPKECLDAFLKVHSERFGKAEVIEVKAGNISVGAPAPELVKDGFMLVGTAAHQVDPIHGGGIGLAMEAGLLAAETAVKAFQAKDYSKKTLSEYEKNWRASEETKLARRLQLRKVLEKLSDDDLNFILSELTASDLQKLLQGDYKPVAAKVLLKRPSLLKILSVIA